MIVFVSGTSAGGTTAQLLTLRKILRPESVTGLMTGGCTGVDEQAVLIMLQEHPGSREKIITYPASDVRDDKRSAWVRRNSGELNAAVPALKRNLIMARRGDIAFFVPRTAHEVQGRAGGGTWAAYRYARQLGKIALIIRPDGLISPE